MYIGRKMTVKLMWLFAKKNVIRTFIISVIVVCIYKFLKIEFIAIPFLPIATIGTAVAFYVGFKNNQAYERLWEARKLWGSLTNVSRTLASSFIALIPDHGMQKQFLLRHVVYINLLRLQLRKSLHWATGNENYHQQSVSEFDELGAFDEAVLELFTRLEKLDIYEQVKNKGNIANLTLKTQFEVVTKLKRQKLLDEYEHSDLTKLLGELFNIQGGCERIKTTPLFRQYSLFSRIFVELFIVLLPFALLMEMNKIGTYGIWLTVPFSVLISWVFMTMEQIGEASENPFDNGLNDIPISTICRNVEIDILEMLGETTLPPRIEPSNNIML